MKTFSRMIVTLTVVVMVLALSLPVFASMDDDRIMSDAKKSHTFQTYLKDDRIAVKSVDGTVTLTGTVDNEYNKSLAQETVASMKGVKSVDNQLVVRGDAPAENSDGWISTKVKTLLLWKRNVSGRATEVSTKDGIVTLKGEADSKAQKDLVTAYAKDIEGVKDVKNEMTIAKTERRDQSKSIGSKTERRDQSQSTGSKIDDASITARVKLALLYHRSTSGLKTSVDTNNGVVTLTGKAANRAQMDLAAKYAGDIDGVKSVTNRMTVEK